jgi:hypothetical protein
MKFLKPYKNCYLLILGSGRTISLEEQQLKAMSMAYDEIRFVKEGSRRSFSLNSEPMEKLLDGIKERRARRRDYD